MCYHLFDVALALGKLARFVDDRLGMLRRTYTIATVVKGPLQTLVNV